MRIPKLRRNAGRPSKDGGSSIDSSTSSIDLSRVSLITMEFAHEQLKKSDEKLAAGDYDGAITSARSFLEGVLGEIYFRCKGERLIGTGDLRQDYRKVKDLLDLSDDSDTHNKLKGMISAFNSIIEGIDVLSNKMGDRHNHPLRPEKHHAKLAVDSAKTMADFLLSTMEYQASRTTAFLNELLGILNVEKRLLPREQLLAAEEIQNWLGKTDKFLRKAVTKELVNGYHITNSEREEKFFAALCVLLDEVTPDDIQVISLIAKDNCEMTGWKDFVMFLQNIRPKLLGKIEVIRSLTNPHIAERYSHPTLEGECLHSSVSEDASVSDDSSLWWLRECMGVPVDIFSLDRHLSRGYSAQLSYRHAYTKFRIVHLAQRQERKCEFSVAWDGVCSALYIKDIRVSLEDREAGLSEPYFLSLLTEIALRHDCKLIAEWVVAEDAAEQSALNELFHQHGFSFTGTDSRAVRHLTPNQLVGEKRYCGFLGERGLGFVTVNGEPLPLVYKEGDSITLGIAWGYGGRGPWELALAITKNLYGEDEMWDKTNGGGTRALRAIWQLVQEELPSEREWMLTSGQIQQYVDQFQEKVGCALAT